MPSRCSRWAQNVFGQTFVQMGLGIREIHGIHGIHAVGGVGGGWVGGGWGVGVHADTRKSLLREAGYMQIHGDTRSHSAPRCPGFFGCPLKAFKLTCTRSSCRSTAQIRETVPSEISLRGTK